MSQVTTGYAPVNGLRMYYEVRGTGRPLVLLHGGLMTIEGSFGPLLPDLGRRPAGDRHRAAGAWPHR
jgi:pimeloyl-ACP methyl ester carboxylesterase